MNKVIAALLVVAHMIGAVAGSFAQGTDVNAKNNHGETPLMKTDKANCVKALIAAGADLNAKDKDDLTALMWAAWQGHPDSVRAFIAAGADLNAKNKDGKTALSLAKSIDVIGILIASGAKL